MVETAGARLVPVPEGLDGLRLDVAVSRLFGLSRSAAAELVDGGRVTLDGAGVARSARVRGGALLAADIPAAEPAAPPRPVPGLDVVHVDADIVVVDKPAGVAAHASTGWEGPTVTGGLAAMGYRLAESGAAERQGVVHRLDAGTSGLMVLARSERAYSLLKQAFKAREVDKRYSALVQGHPDPSRGTVDAPIDRHPGGGYRFAVVAGGRPSVTHYETAEALRAASLLDIRLETGRTHQIRVHMAAVRHPCVGDLSYGADPTLAARLGLHRQWLHARRLGFAHPGTGRPVEFASAFPPDLQAALTSLREGS